MITKYERTILDLWSAIAAQIIEGEKPDRQEAKQSADDGTDLRRLRNVQHAQTRSGNRSIRLVQ